MRFILMIICLFGALHAAAQGGASLLRTTSKGVSVGGIPVRMVQGKMLPSALRNPSYNHQMAHIRSLLERQIKERTWSDLPFVHPNASSIGVKTGMQLYRKTLADFEHLRQELNPILFYQSNPQERRTLTPNEKRDIVNKIDQVHVDMKRLSAYISLTEPNLRMMQEYMDEALRLLVPEVGKIPFTKPIPRTDRVFRPDEFFLRDPQFSVLQRMYRKVLPTKHLRSLKLAILNDEREITYALWDAYRRGEFIPWGQLFVYEDPQKLIRDMREGICSPNFVLTDLILPGSSGYLVTEQLRQIGYQGPIVGFAAFKEHPSIAREMFDYGLDGFITASKVFYQVPFWQDRIHLKISNYLYYQKLNNWPHSYTEDL